MISQPTVMSMALSLTAFGVLLLGMGIRATDYWLSVVLLPVAGWMLAFAVLFWVMFALKEIQQLRVNR